MSANHGGGYSYRLCKIPEEGKSGLTEECFQKMPLRFASNEQYVQTGYDRTTRRKFTANRTTTGMNINVYQSIIVIRMVQQFNFII